eukprot:RCo052408
MDLVDRGADVVSVDQRRARRRLEHAAQHRNRRGLPGPVGPKQAEAAVLVDAQAEVPHGGAAEAVSKALPQRTDQHRRGGPGVPALPTVHRALLFRHVTVHRNLKGLAPTVLDVFLVRLRGPAAVLAAAPAAEAGVLPDPPLRGQHLIQVQPQQEVQRREDPQINDRRHELPYVGRRHAIQLPACSQRGGHPVDKRVRRDHHVREGRGLGVVREHQQLNHNPRDPHHQHQKEADHCSDDGPVNKCGDQHGEADAVQAHSRQQKEIISKAGLRHPPYLEDEQDNPEDHADAQVHHNVIDGVGKPVVPHLHRIQLAQLADSELLLEDDVVAEERDGEDEDDRKEERPQGLHQVDVGGLVQVGHSHQPSLQEEPLGFHDDRSHGCD